MLSESFSEDVIVGPEGRILLSARVRKALAVAPKETLRLRIDGGRLTIEKRDDVARRLKTLVKAAAGKKSLSASLLKERRREAAKGK